MINNIVLQDVRCQTNSFCTGFVECKESQNGFMYFRPVKKAASRKKNAYFFHIIYQ